MSFPVNAPTTNVVFVPAYKTPNPADASTNVEVPASWQFTIQFSVPLSDQAVPPATWSVTPNS